MCDSGSMSVSRQSRAFGFAACALASALWGTGFFFGKIALAEMGFAPMVLFRFLFGAVVLLPLLVTHPPRFDRREWALLLAASFLGVPLQFLIQFYGLSLTTVSHASLMVGTMPVILAVGAAVFAHERMDALGWLALAGSTAGAALIALSGKHGRPGEASLAGDLLVVASLGIALFWLLINKRLMERHSHIAVTAYGVVLGTLMLLVWVPVRYGLPPLDRISFKVWLALAASGVLCTAATHAALELGHDAGARLAGRCPAEHGAAGGFTARRLRSGRAAWPRSLGRWRTYPRRRPHPHHAQQDPRPRTDARQLNAHIHPSRNPEEVAWSG